MAETPEGHGFDYSVLVEMSRMLNTFMLTDDLLEFSLEVLMECSGLLRGIILVYDHDREELYVRASRMWETVERFQLKALSDDELNFVKLRPNASLLDSWQPRSQEIIDLSQSHRLLLSETFPALPPFLELYRLIVLIPLVHQGMFKGMVAMGEPMTESVFSVEPNRQLLLALADLTATSLENIELRESAVIDTQTRLYTHRYFRDRVEQEIERATAVGKKFSLLLLDIDKFKSIVDRVGHVEGDGTLRLLGNVLKQHVRDKLDFVGRYGGDEFVICLLGVDLAVALTVAERIRKDISELVLPNIGRMTVSIGAAGFPSVGRHYEAILAVADKGLGKAKAAGGNSVVTVEELYGERKPPYGSTDYSLSIKDRVTEFYLGEYFFDRWETELARSRRHGHLCCVVAASIDRRGVLRGMVSGRELDEILCSFSNAMLMQLRQGTDLPARYLNDTVLFILPETSTEGGRRFAGRIARRLSRYPFPPVRGFGRIRFNFSVVGYPRDGVTVSELLQHLLELAALAEEGGGGVLAWREEGGELKTEPLETPKEEGEEAPA